MWSLLLILFSLNAVKPVTWLEGCVRGWVEFSWSNTSSNTTIDTPKQQIRSSVSDEWEQVTSTFALFSDSRQKTLTLLVKPLHKDDFGLYNCSEGGSPGMYGLTEYSPGCDETSNKPPSLELVSQLIVLLEKYSIQPVSEQDQGVYWCIQNQTYKMSVQKIFLQVFTADAVVPGCIGGWVEFTWPYKTTDTNVAVFTPTQNMTSLTGDQWKQVTSTYALYNDTTGSYLKLMESKYDCDTVYAPNSEFTISDMSEQDLGVYWCVYSVYRAGFRVTQQKRLLQENNPSSIEPSSDPGSTEAKHAETWKDLAAISVPVCAGVLLLALLLLCILHKKFKFFHKAPQAIEHVQLCSPRDSLCDEREPMELSSDCLLPGYKLWLEFFKKTMALYKWAIYFRNQGEKIIRSSNRKKKRGRKRRRNADAFSPRTDREAEEGKEDDEKAENADARIDKVEEVEENVYEIIDDTYEMSENAYEIPNDLPGVYVNV
ncbi:hypothetical protein WMY93_011502 [Mugilogobius chulae]|uniref:Ig-like domain-containing protein n=1 Tax=Mugilogobius chulae TaxID=88201 RepID=A0AAW0P8K3_9GOBI